MSRYTNEPDESVVCTPEFGPVKTTVAPGIGWPATVAVPTARKRCCGCGLKPVGVLVTANGDNIETSERPSIAAAWIGGELVIYKNPLPLASGIKSASVSIF